MITLPALCFDKLEASVNTHGLGAGRYYRFEDEACIPCDFLGHFETCFGEAVIPPHRFGITARMSDRAVFAINKRKHVFRGSLVTWNEFVAELDIRRCDLSAHESSIKRDPYREISDAPSVERYSMEG